jgi:LytS/YehU family sensor histidine kinase
VEGFGYVYVLVRLLEKAAVLTAAAFLISLLRPFQRLLEGRANWKRQAALATVFGVLALWGTHLGLGWQGLNPNTRAVGVITAGFLGGPLVGVTVGLFAGSYTAVVSGGPAATLLILASVMDGALASAFVQYERRRLKLTNAPPALLVRRLGAPRAFLAAVAIQFTHLVTIGAILLIARPTFFTRDLAQYLAFIPEVGGVAIGVALFLMVLRNALGARAQERQLSWQVAAAARAKLSALQAQVRPHFLYNSLTTIASLVRTDPAAARYLLGQLATFYRATVEHGDVPIPLKEEIARLEPYLEIERARMGDRLKVELAVAPAAGEVLVPPFLLQPLVENAIKHGLAPKPRGGTVWVQAAIAAPAPGGTAPAAVLRLSVEDDGVGHSGAPFGVGLSNLRERLASMYGDGAGLEVGGRDRGGAQARVWLPTVLPAGASAPPDVKEGAA